MSCKRITTITLDIGRLPNWIAPHGWLSFDLKVTRYVVCPPAPGSVSTVTFSKDPCMPLPNLIGTITLKPTDPADNVTARAVKVDLTTPGQPAQPTLSLDGLAATVTFPCLVDDQYSITVVDTNANGDAPAGTPLTGTASVTGGGGGGGVPKPGEVASVTFAEAP